MKIKRNDSYVMFSGTKQEGFIWLNELFKLGKNEFANRRAMMDKNHPDWVIEN